MSSAHYRRMGATLAKYGVRRGGGIRLQKRRMQGRGIKEFFGKVNQFLRKHRVLSNVGNAVSGLMPEGKWKTGLSLASKGASALGYGRRRRVQRRGRGLTLAGM